MPRRRSRARRQASQLAATMSDEQIRVLVARLQEVIPELQNRITNEMSTARMLAEVCNYIRTLQRETQDLSQRIAAQLDNMDSAQADAIRRLLASLDPNQDP